MTLYGWVCPVCGRGVSPMVESCDCRANGTTTTSPGIVQDPTTGAHYNHCNRCYGDWLGQYPCPNCYRSTPDRPDVAPDRSWGSKGDPTKQPGQ